MTPEEFERLLDQWEGETLEFKREMPASSDLAKLVTAFYNTRGGTIIFGVADDARQLVGVANPQGIEGGIVNILRARCSLDVMPAIEVLSFQGKEFVVVTCPQGAHKPISPAVKRVPMCASAPAIGKPRTRKCDDCTLRVMRAASRRCRVAAPPSLTSRSR